MEFETGTYLGHYRYSIDIKSYLGMMHTNLVLIYRQ
jgi:hypothetical protein